MPNAKTITVLGAAILLLPGCHKAGQQQAGEENVTLDQGLSDNRVAGNADIETLPADESSTTPSNQLQNGFDSPDLNEPATSNSQ